MLDAFAAEAGPSTLLEGDGQDDYMSGNPGKRKKKKNKKKDGRGMAECRPPSDARTHCG